MEFSVVIPTYNRVRILEKTLQGLAGQSLTDFEVILVDDGSEDSTAELALRVQQEFPVPLHYFFQSNKKQGAARNLGARNASGRLLVFLGDDTVPEAEFLKEHHRSHIEHSRRDKEGKRNIVIGYTTWPGGYAKTKFLEYIGEQGWQFGFSLIEDPEDVPFNYFYTSNLSMSAEFFLESGGFDEDFKEYGWEDIELSLRLKRAGMRIIYNSKAKSCHHHPISFESFIKRQRKAGCSAWNFYRKHMEMGSFLGLNKVPDYTKWQKMKMRLLTQLCKSTENLSWPDLSRYYPDLMTYYYMLGVIEGRPKKGERFLAERTSPGKELAKEHADDS